MGFLTFALYIFACVDINFLRNQFNHSMETNRRRDSHRIEKHDTCEAAMTYATSGHFCLDILWKLMVFFFFEENVPICDFGTFVRWYFYDFFYILKKKMYSIEYFDHSLLNFYIFRYKNVINFFLIFSYKNFHNIQSLLLYINII